MGMEPGLRKFALTAHVVSSVGWLGAVVGFLALSVAGVAGEDAQTVRAVYIAMEATGRYVVVPLSLASLLTGLVQALGTPWGLFRHYWVVAKLVINVLATVVLLMYMQTLDYFAGIAARTPFTAGDLRELRSPSHVVHAGAALVLLLVAVVLSVYKPRGLTGYGRRKQRARAQPRRAASQPSG